MARLWQHAGRKAEHVYSHAFTITCTPIFHDSLHSCLHFLSQLEAQIKQACPYGYHETGGKCAQAYMTEEYADYKQDCPYG
jgi:hypothetical protein